jgi:hypothetical protein
VHGSGTTHESAVTLTLWPNDGKYLIKGVGPKVWKKFRLRKEHRRLQGLIVAALQHHGERRSGCTQAVQREHESSKLENQLTLEEGNPISLLSPKSNRWAQRMAHRAEQRRERRSRGMKQIRDDFATHDFKAWLAQLIQRVEQMHLPTSYAMERIATWRAYFEKGYSPREAAREEVAYEAARRARLPQVHRSSA